ncbi:hypothetical protein CKM354_001114100 [Cercospora kikuchii]|uniref:Uncharacterized protein n=1 Tax=Cercospora kikuchii TaxID=84275 RepID=A0A9P3CSZ7_9PEZI|nr:uncharacterized protein CKM354_001114100 [Cercospora kikuchii]GIZ48066.1 hypothetical protein CKM354_001114100 [Cercospora kikuchii]
MPRSNITWANVCRQANGERLETSYSKIVTPAQAALLRSKFELMLLDPEIRERIIEYAVRADFYSDQPVIAVFRPGQASGLLPAPPAIKMSTLTRARDRQLRLETIRSTLMTVVLEVHSGWGNARLQQWLSELRLSEISKNMTDGFDAVRALRFPYFSRFPYHLPHITSNDDINLMLKCKGLKSVAIAFYPGSVVSLWGTGVLGSELSADQLVRNYHLENMLELKELEELQFLQYCGHDPSLGIPALAKWFKNEYQQRKASGLRVKTVRVFLPDGSEV